jgi:hypothetical protein
VADSSCLSGQAFGGAGEVGPADAPVGAMRASLAEAEIMYIA